ncbi:partial leucyl aminopeptidase, partial [Patescibacteria group bacterium]
MDYSIETLSLKELQSECLLVGVYQNLQLAVDLNDDLARLVQSLIERGDVSGKNGETALIHVLDNAIQRVLLVGLGERAKLNSKNYRKALSAAINALKKTTIKSATCSLVSSEVQGCDEQWKARVCVEVFNDALYEFKELKSNKESDIKLENISIVVSEEHGHAAYLGVQQGRAIADGMAFTKRLADLPANICTPSYLAKQAIELANRHDKLSVEVLEESDMQALGMGCLLAVSRGSRQPAKLICLNYQGGEPNNKPIVFIGKGLTFDAGGISLKPGLGMDEMKYDMC